VVGLPFLVGVSNGMIPLYCIPGLLECTTYCPLSMAKAWRQGVEREGGVRRTDGGMLGWDVH